MRLKQIFAIFLCAFLLSSVITIAQEKKTDNKELLLNLGILKHGKMNMQGQQEILILKEGPRGVFTYQHLTNTDGKDFKTILRNNGLVRKKINISTDKPEDHILVFNPKDKHTYTWVPFSLARQVGKRIKKTGKTFPKEKAPQRITDNNLDSIDDSLEF